MKLGAVLGASLLSIAPARGYPGEDTRLDIFDDLFGDFPAAAP